MGFEAELLKEFGASIAGVEEILVLKQDDGIKSLLFLFSMKMIITQMRMHSNSHEKNAKSASSVVRAPSGFVSAIDESTTKIFNQALKPVNTLVYGVQDQYTDLVRGSSGAPSTSSAHSLVTFFFKDLKAVSIATESPVLQLEDHKSEVHMLPFEVAFHGDGVFRALAGGLQSAISHPDARATWEELRIALCLEKKHQQA